MNAKCYFCDKELEAVVYDFKVGPRDEPVCEECNVKTLNRRKSGDAETK